MVFKWSYGSRYNFPVFLPDLNWKRLGREVSQKSGLGVSPGLFKGKFAHQMCVLPSVKLILFKVHCNCRWISCVYVADLNFMIFMDFLWFVLLLSFGNGAHFKKNRAPAREVSKKNCACNTSPMGANMCFPFGCQAPFFSIYAKRPPFPQ